MGISVATLITTALLFYYIAKNNRHGINAIFKDLFLFTVFVSIFISTGSFLNIGTISIGYDTVVSSVAFVFAIIVLLSDGHKADNKLSILALLLITCLVLNIILMIFFPYQGKIINHISDWDGYVLGTVEKAEGVQFSFVETFLLLFAFIRMVVILCAASKCFSKTDDFSSALNKSIHMSDIIILYGYAELVLKFIFHISLTQVFLFPFFGESETYIGTDRLIGFTKEASQYATSLFLLVTLYIIKLHNNKVTRNNSTKIYARIVLTIVLLICSTSFAAFYYLILIGLLILVTCLNMKWRIIVAGCGVLAVVLAAFTMKSEITERLERTFTVIYQLFNGENVLPTSEGARLTSIFDSIIIFLNRPLLGVGLGATDAHSTLVSVLVNCGLSGFILWLMFLMRLNVKGGRSTNWLIFILILSMLYTGGIGYAAKIYYPFIIMVSAGVSVNSNNKGYKKLEKAKKIGD